MLVTGGQSTASATVTTVRSYDITGARWATLAPLAIARQRHGCTHFKEGESDRVIVAGGIGTSSVTLDSVEIYDPALNAWTSGPALPLPVSHLELVLVDGAVWAVGGVEGQARTSRSEKIYALRSDLSGWDEAPVDFPGGLVHGAALVFNEMI